MGLAGSCFRFSVWRHKLTSMRASLSCLLVFCGALFACGPTGLGPKTGILRSSLSAAVPDAKQSRRAQVDYVAIGGRDVLVAMEPLFRHREAGGHVVERVVLEDLKKPEGVLRPEEIVGAIRKVAAVSGKRLRYVLLAGDVPGEAEDVEGFVEVPTFYGPKLRYENRPRDDEHAFEGFFDEFEASHLLRDYGLESYPTDLPYAFAHRGVPGQPELASADARALAVGRIPVRTAEEARGFANKVIAYETKPAEGTWRRSITLFSGPANFGAFADYLIENTMTRTLDDEVPYDWDVDIIFPKVGSPYAYPLPDLSTRMTTRMEEGALIAGYVGHGAPMWFDDVRFHGKFYSTGSVRDLKPMDIKEGNPFFVSMTCSNGHFDLPNGRKSVAEVLVLNPHGAIAVFASSRESHPYSNALYGIAIVKTFVEERPISLGEGVVTMKDRMKKGDLPIAPLLFKSDPAALAVEHEALYNLFGDPATVLRYPEKAMLTLEGAKDTRLSGEEVVVTVEAKGVEQGKAIFTLETKRSVVRAPAMSADELKQMEEDDAFWAMKKIFDLATDKVITRVEAVVVGHKASVRIKLPAEAGDYAIKGYVTGGGEAAAGSLRVKVVR